MIKSKYFKIFELVPAELNSSLHEDLLWNMLDLKLILSIDKVKEKFPDGTMTINSYKWGGDRGWSGIRTKNSKFYSEKSQHSVGKAVDAVFSYYTAKEVRDYILENQDMFPHIGGIEMGVSWLHIDVRDRVNGQIVQFYA